MSQFDAAAAAAECAAIIDISESHSAAPVQREGVFPGPYVSPLDVSARSDEDTTIGRKALENQGFDALCHVQSLVGGKLPGLDSNQEKQILSLLHELFDANKIRAGYHRPEGRFRPPRTSPEKIIARIEAE